MNLCADHRGLSPTFAHLVAPAKAWMVTALRTPDEPKSDI